MVQRITLSKTNADALATSELALWFTDSLGHRWHTPRISLPLAAGDVDLATGDYTASAATLQAALRALPTGVLQDVRVSVLPSASGFDAARNLVWLVTFPGRLAGGNQSLLQCHEHLGCNAPGCQPRHQQLVSITEPATGVTRNAAAVLARGTSSAVINAQVLVDIECSNAVAVVGTSGNVVYRVREATDAASAAGGTWSAWSPVPYGPARWGVAVGSHGLVVDFSDSTATQAVCATGSYSFAWSVPTCSVTVDTLAGRNFEHAECSSRGKCATTSGTCACEPGFTGGACEQRVGGR
jgi:hypothetical protein